MGVTYDASAWPVAVVAIEGRLKDAELDAFLREVDDWIARGEHLLVLDLTGNVGVDIRHLRRTASWLAERRDRLQRRTATIYVIGSPFMRAAISLVYKLSADRGRHHVCETATEAHALARALLEADSEAAARCA